MDFSALLVKVTEWLSQFGLKVLGAIVIWIVGTWLIKTAVSLVSKSFSKSVQDKTLVTYLGTGIGVVLKVILIVALLGYFGVETTSFAALLAAFGIAIGAAWGGLLANFAAGAFLVFLRPFKVGDIISAGGTTGTVEEIGLFSTIINTPENVRTYVGNNKIFSDSIANFTANSYRRVDLLAQLDHSVNIKDAIALLQKNAQSVPNVVADPPVEVFIVTFNQSGPVLAVRPYTNPVYYGQVVGDTNMMIADSFGSAGYPIPTSHQTSYQK